MVSLGVGELRQEAIPPAERPSVCHCPSERQKGSPRCACLDPCASLRAGLPWRCPAPGELEAAGSAVFGGTALLPLLLGGKGAAEILLWGEDTDPGARCSLCLPQPPALPPSCLRLQGPEPRSGRHRGDHLRPPCPGLGDERAGHLEEVGGPSLTDLRWVVTLCSQAPVSVPAFAHAWICTCKHIAVQMQAWLV